MIIITKNHGLINSNNIENIQIKPVTHQMDNIINDDKNPIMLVKFYIDYYLTSGKIISERLEEYEYTCKFNDVNYELLEIQCSKYEKQIANVIWSDKIINVEIKKI